MPARSNDDYRPWSDAVARIDPRDRRGMRHAYGKGGRESMTSHCERLEKDFRNAAAAYRELAKEHRQMAADPK